MKQGKDYIWLSLNKLSVKSLILGGQCHKIGFSCPDSSTRYQLVYRNPPPETASIEEENN